MVVAVCKPETVLYLEIDVPFALQKCNSTDPVPLFDVVLESRHFLGLDFVIGAIFSIVVFDFGLGD